jgi:hypothetical protein
MTNEARRWYLLVHQLPPKPAYLRAKIGHRLARVGGIALKNSVYVLPERDDCLEDLQWIAQEAVAGGGEAFVLRAEFLAGVTDSALQERFRRQATEVYEELKGDVRRALDATRADAGETGRDPGTLLRLKKRLDELVEVDFFGVPIRKEVEAMLQALESRVHGTTKGTRGRPAARSRLVGRTWVTRRDPKVDRLASAWLIRRFVDPGARFRFLDPKREGLRPGEIGFDMVGGEFTHEGDHCTFEVLLARLGLREAALRQVAEVVHDIDLKDGKFGRPDAAGVQQLVRGLVQAHADDEARLTAGLGLFDHLYLSFSGGPGTARGKHARPRAARGK